MEITQKQCGVGIKMKGLKVSEIVRRYNKNRINVTQILDSYISAITEENLILSQSDMVSVLEELQTVLDSKEIDD